MIRLTAKKTYKALRVKQKIVGMRLNIIINNYYSGTSFKIKLNSYQILGVSVSASEQQIKKAYLQAVKKHHPDLTADSDSVQKFREIQQAYDNISSAEKREQYNKGNFIRNMGAYQTKSSAKVETKESEFSEGQKEKIEQFEQKFGKGYCRKEGVPDEFQFSYNLYKETYEKIRQKKSKQYIRYPGQRGEQYYAHRDQQPESQMKPILASVAIISIFACSCWYVLK